MNHGPNDVIQEEENEKAEDEKDEKDAKEKNGNKVKLTANNKRNVNVT